jgi:hypothetical protein
MQTTTSPPGASRNLSASNVMFLERLAQFAEGIAKCAGAVKDAGGIDDRRRLVQLDLRCEESDRNFARSIERVEPDAQAIDQLPGHVPGKYRVQDAVEPARRRAVSAS